MFDVGDFSFVQFRLYVGYALLLLGLLSRWCFWSICTLVYTEQVLFGFSPLVSCLVLGLWREGINCNIAKIVNPVMIGLCFGITVSSLGQC